MCRRAHDLFGVPASQSFSPNSPEKKHNRIRSRHMLTGCVCVDTAYCEIIAVACGTSNTIATLCARRGACHFMPLLRFYGVPQPSTSSHKTRAPIPSHSLSCRCANDGGMAFIQNTTHSRERERDRPHANTLPERLPSVTVTLSTSHPPPADNAPMRHAIRFPHRTTRSSPASPK